MFSAVCHSPQSEGLSLSPFFMRHASRGGCSVCQIPVTSIPFTFVPWAGPSPMCICILCDPHTLPTSMSTPFPSSDKPCELHCLPLGKESPLLVADRVLDGTPCGPYETDLCVHGRCQVMCFPYILGGALEGRLPLPKGAWA